MAADDRSMDTDNDKILSHVSGTFLPRDAL